MKYEAFVYLWYDAPNKKYYLGKHKGTPDDSYTHSSTMWEHFTKDNIPEGVTRRILAYGTHEEMCVLEHNLLVNRKKRCWDRYYNNSLGDPRYVDVSGENNPMWKGGISYDKKAWQKEYMKKYRQKYSEYAKEWMREYRQKPEVKEHMREYERKRGQTPEYKAWKKKYNAEYHKAHWQKPEVKENHRVYMRAWRAKKKLERQGTGTLEPFMG